MSRNRNKTMGRKRLVLALGSAVALTVLVTSAAFSDFANLNLGAKDKGIAAGKFNIQICGPAYEKNEGPMSIKCGPNGPKDQEWIEAHESDGISLNLNRQNNYGVVEFNEGATFAPGSSGRISFCYRVTTDSDYRGALTATVRDQPGKTTDPAMKSLITYQFYESDKYGSDSGPLGPAKIQNELGNVVLKTLDPDIEVEDQWGKGGYESSIHGCASLKVVFPDQGSPNANNAFQMKQAFPQLVVTGTSVE